MEKNANINAQKNDGDTVLHTAVNSEKPNLDIVRFLLKNNSENKNLKANINAQNCCDNTPLHNAVQMKMLDFVECLLNNRANVNVLNYNLDTPHCLAVQSNQLDLADLISKTMNTNEIELEKAIRKKDSIKKVTKKLNSLGQFSSELFFVAKCIGL